MLNRKELKKKAKVSLREHLGIWILLCVVSAILSGETLFPKFTTSAEEYIGNGSVATSLSSVSDGFVEILAELGEGRIEEGRELVNQNIQDTIDASEQNKILGRSRGVFSDIVNRVTSGSFLLTFGAGIHSIVGSGSASMIILIIISLIVAFAVWTFIFNPYQAVMARMFLEGRCYEKIHSNRILFLVKSGYWKNVSFAMLRASVYEILWAFTIVGGVIKHYSYYMVPYIIAENPTISGKEAINLSRRMMDGHKWECFVFELSFIGWEILSTFTFGILGIVFVRPYQSATFCEYYAWLREENIKTNLDGIDKLNDTYLHLHPTDDKMKMAYSDVISAIEGNNTEEDSENLRGIFLILAKYFGITVRNSEAEKKFSDRQAREQSLYFEKEELEKKIYPSRLSQIQREQKEKSGSANAMRPYSIWSLIMIYFTAAFIGWVWEVSLHLITDGNFVNRGVLHGPWLPIYGTGCVLILVLLYWLRKNPLAEFIAAIVVCGIVEYGTAYYLETIYDGARWWDYTGYFLNLHGRICAEGLLVFGVGGLAIVYLLAPALDNLFRKIKYNVLLVISLCLLIIFSIDNTYSKKHPNTGEGISSYTSEANAKQ